MAGYTDLYLAGRARSTYEFHIDTPDVAERIRNANPGKRAITLQLDGDELEAALWGLENYRKGGDYTVEVAGQTMTPAEFEEYARTHPGYGTEAGAEALREYQEGSAALDTARRTAPPIGLISGPGSRSRVAFDTLARAAFEDIEARSVTEDPPANPILEALLDEEARLEAQERDDAIAGVQADARNAATEIDEADEMTHQNHIDAGMLRDMENCPVCVAKVESDQGFIDTFEVSGQDYNEPKEMRPLQALADELKESYEQVGNRLADEARADQTDEPDEEYGQVDHD